MPKLETLVATLKRKFTLGVLLEEWIGPDDKHSGANVIQVNYKSSVPRLKTLVRHGNRNILKRLLNSYYVFQIDQPNLGLPSRDYYLHAESQRDLQVYFEYMTDVAMIMGANKSEAEKQLHDVIELEIQLANVSCIEDISSVILRIK